MRLPDLPRRARTSPVSANVTAAAVGFGSDGLGALRAAIGQEVAIVLEVKGAMVYTLGFAA